MPYEYAIALSENAVDNGVELRIRREINVHFVLPHMHDILVLVTSSRHSYSSILFDYNGRIY
jgi:hypothetical protein